MTPPVHYQQQTVTGVWPQSRIPGSWPVCGEHPAEYNRTETMQLVTCPKCLDVITPPFIRGSGSAVCERCEKLLYEHPHMKFGILELFRRCDGVWIKA